jgi:hypothetical protein
MHNKDYFDFSSLELYKTVKKLGSLNPRIRFAMVTRPPPRPGPSPSDNTLACCMNKQTVAQMSVWPE